MRLINRYYPKSLTVSMSLSLDGLFIIVQLIIGHTIKRILGVGRFVNGRIVLVATLDDALRCGAHQYDMIVGARNRGVLDTTGLVPCDALENVRLRTGGDFVRSPIVLDLG